MNTLSMYKKPREAGLATKKKEVSLFLFSFVWVNTEWYKRDGSWSLKQLLYPLPQKSIQ